MGPLEKVLHRHRLHLTWRGEFARDCAMAFVVFLGCYLAWILLVAVT